MRRRRNSTVMCLTAHETDNNPPVSLRTLYTTRAICRWDPRSQRSLHVARREHSSRRPPLKQRRSPCCSATTNNTRWDSMCLDGVVTHFFSKWCKAIASLRRTRQKALKPQGSADDTTWMNDWRGNKNPYSSTFAPLSSSLPSTSSCVRRHLYENDIYTLDPIDHSFTLTSQQYRRPLDQNQPRSPPQSQNDESSGDPRHRSPHPLSLPLAWPCPP